MHSRKGLFIVLATTLIFATSFTGCVKKRGDFAMPGENLQKYETLPGSNLQSFDAMGNPTKSGWSQSDLADDTMIVYTDYTITVTGTLKPIMATTAKKLVVEEGTTFVSFPNIVTFSTDDPYLTGKDVIAEMFGGAPGTTYKVVHEFSPNYMTISKVVTDAQVSTVEKTYSRKRGNQWIVPIGGYAVTYANIQKALNEDKRQTNIIQAVPVLPNEFRTATSFYANKTAFIKFGRVEKFDMVPKSYFLSGEWYISETVVSVRDDVSANVGEIGTYDSNFNSASRIIFDIKDDLLVGLNTNVDPKYKNEANKENYNLVIKFPVQPLDYKRDTTGTNTMNEVEDSVKDKGERRYLKLDFLNAETQQSAEQNVLAKIYNRVSNFRVLLDVTYSDNFMSFSIHDPGAGTIKRFALRRVDPKKTYKSRRLFKEDNLIFGAFQESRAKAHDQELNTQEDYEKLVMMARHDPANDIVYYFSDQTPKDKWYRDMGREAINIWQQAFVKAGLTNKIILKEDRDIPLGDIRYNILNIVNKGIGGSLGFGPSLTDSNDGEIVSVSMNLGMEPILARHFSAVRDYMARKSGRVYDLTKSDIDSTIPMVFNLAQAINGQNMSLNAAGQVILNNFKGLTPDKTHLDASVFTDPEIIMLRDYGLSPNASIEEVVAVFNDRQQKAALQGKKMDMLTGFKFYAAEQSAFSSTSVNDEFIEKHCPEVVALKNRMATEIVFTPEELPIITPCVNVLAQTEGLWATIHEMGHNLSLRHNFMGSTDEKNFPDLGSYTFRYMQFPQDLQKKKTSSVMDYLTTEGRQLMPGAYDIAAIRWIFKGQVQTAAGTWVTIPETKRIQDVLPNMSNLKAYSFCTDEQRVYGTNPLCNLFDQGLSSRDVVKYYIDDTYKFLATSLYRGDKNRALGTVRVVDQNNDVTPYLGLYMDGQVKLLKRHYDNWRYFLRQFTGGTKAYLQKMSKDDYVALIARIKETNPKELEEHLIVRNMIVRFLVDIAFLNNKYCQVVDIGTGANKRLIELQKIRQDLFAIGDKSVVSSCRSPSVTTYLTKLNVQFVKEFGHFIDDGQFTLDPDKLEAQDFAGTTSVRMSAVLGLVTRTFSSSNNAIQKIAPNFLDEPDIREFITDVVLDRIINGVRVNPTKHDVVNTEEARLFDQSDTQKLLGYEVFKNFEREKELISATSKYIQLGLRVPSDQDETIARTRPLFAGLVPSLDLVKDRAKNHIELPQGVLYVVDDDTFAGIAMSSMQSIGQGGQTASVSPDKLKEIQASFMSDFSDVLPKTGTQLTIKDLLVVTSKVRELIGSLDPSKDEAKILALKSVFSAEFAISKMAQEAYAEVAGISIGGAQEQLKGFGLSEEAKKQLQDVIDKGLAQVIMPIYEELKKQDPTLLPISTESLNKRYGQLVNMQAEIYNDFKVNGEEYESQTNLIFNVLTGLVN